MSKIIKENGVEILEVNIKDKVLTDDDILYMWYLCDKCKYLQIRHPFNYCPMCSIKIKWII